MSHKLVDLMNSIQEYVEKYFMQNRHSPFTAEIAEDDYLLEKLPIITWMP